MRATLSISIRRADGELWGLVPCHHLTPKHVSQHTRLVCELLARAFSLQVGALEKVKRHLRATALARATAHLLSVVADGPTRMDALHANSERLLALVDADGAVIQLDGETRVVGTVPAGADVKLLLDLVADQPVVSDELSALEPHMAMSEPGVAGILGVRGPPGSDEAIVFWRSEAPRVITWGNEPLTSDAIHRSVPSHDSFSPWTEIVVGHSREWEDAEVDAAVRLARELPITVPTQD